MAEIATVNVIDLMKNIKINIVITGYKRFRIRLVIGSFLIKLGARVIGTDVKVECKE